jgi:hypothetical protein
MKFKKSDWDYTIKVEAIEDSEETKQWIGSVLENLFYLNDIRPKSVSCAVEESFMTKNKYFRLDIILDEEKSHSNLPFEYNMRYGNNHSVMIQDGNNLNKFYIHNQTTQKIKDTINNLLNALTYQPEAKVEGVPLFIREDID